MKKIVQSALVLVILLSAQAAFAQTGKGSASTEVENKDSHPSITVEFKDMDKLSDEFQEIEKGFDGKNIEIHYDDARGLGGIIAVGLGFIFFILILALASCVFWIVMMVHAISKPIKSKAVWILILLIFGVIGAIVYYFAVKREFKDKKNETVYAEKTEN